MGDRRNTCGILDENRKGRDHFGDPGMDGRITLK
jgi:hypothetical protein